MTGKITRLVSDKGFGFILCDFNKVDYFFHRTSFDGHWLDLIQDFESRKEIRVEFDEVTSNKGPRAESVKLI